jgi:hypothetical protein
MVRSEEPHRYINTVAKYDQHVGRLRKVVSEGIDKDAATSRARDRAR